MKRVKLMEQKAPTLRSIFNRYNEIQWNKLLKDLVERESNKEWSHKYTWEESLRTRLFATNPNYKRDDF